MKYPEKFGVSYPPQMIAINVYGNGPAVAYCPGHEPDLSTKTDDDIGEVYPWTLDESAWCGACGKEISA